MRFARRILGSNLLLCLVCLARGELDERGFELGSFHIRPEGFSELYSDSRVEYDASGVAQGDVYGELGAAIFLNNADARYQVIGNGVYGYRAYNEYVDFSDDFFSGLIWVATRQNPLKYGVSVRVRKTLDYDTAVDLFVDQEPGAILSSGVSTRYSATADLEYEKRLGGRAHLIPSYTFFHYYQDFETGDPADWQIHQVGLQLGYEVSSKTVLTLSGYERLEVNEQEKGAVSTVALGANGRSSEKTIWNMEVGFSFADYEWSGKEQSLFAALRGTWQVSEKMSVYALGSSDFQPGYNGGAARQIYRLGYGAGWDPLTRWSVDCQLLHNYQDEFGASSVDPINGKVLHFITAQLEYHPSTHFSLSVGGTYNKDEEAEAQQIASLKATIRY